MRALRKISILLLLLAGFVGSVSTAIAQPFIIFGYTNQFWKYTGDNMDGTGWQGTTYDDSAWSTNARASLGYEAPGGTLDSLNAAGATINTFIPQPASGSRYTYYFRTHFNLPVPATGVSLIFSNRIDDGAVFYLNGVEIGRLGIASTVDPVTYMTFAASSEATTLRTFTTNNAPSLVQGDNVLAIEVHNQAADSSDLVLAVALTGATVFSPVINYAASSLTNRTVTPCVGTSTLSVSASGFPTPTYQWFEDGNPIANATNSTYQLSNLRPPGSTKTYYVAVSNSQGTTNTIPSTVVTIPTDTVPPTVVSAFINPDLAGFTVNFSEAVPPNHDVTGNWLLVDTTTGATIGLLVPYYTNSSSIVVPTDPESTIDPSHGFTLTVLDVVDDCGNNLMTETNVPLRFQFELIRFDAPNNEWRYSTETNLFGTGWETVGYDDSGGTWATGEQALGRDANVNGVPIRTQTYPQVGGVNTSAPQFYRRHFFLPTGTNGLILTARHVFEDGGVVYLNGQEAGRFNVGAGTLSVTTRATANAADPLPISAPVTLPLTNVFPGDNVIAVVVFQNGANSSDSVMALELTGTAPRIPAGPPVITTQPQSQPVNEGANATLSVVVDGLVPFTYQWRKAGAPIDGATNAFLTITNAIPGGGGSGGNYDVLITNSVGNAASAVATLTVTPDNTAPSFVSAVGSVNLTNITLTITDASGLNEAAAETAANYAVALTAGGGALTVLSATQVNNTTIQLTTSARTQGQNYTVTLSNIRDSSAAANLVTPLTRPLQAGIILFSYNHVWRYDESGADLGTAWKDVGYNDSAWPSGAGFLALETSSGPLILFTNLAGGSGTNTSLSVTNFGGIGGRTITYYFRTSTGNLPFDPTLPGNSVRATAYFDDGGVIYVNGAEAMRFNLTNTPGVLNYTNFASVGSTEGAGGLVTSNLTGFVQANNIIAAEVHQNAVDSSDIAWGLQLEGLVSTFGPSGPTMTIRVTGPVFDPPPGGGNVSFTITWTGGGTLQRTTNITPPITWEDVPGATSPYNATSITPAQRFYRVRVP